MKTITVITLLIFTLISCNDFISNETIISNRGKHWHVEIIESHEFLYRDDNGSFPYIHRPNCGACRLNKLSDSLLRY